MPVDNGDDDDRDTPHLGTPDADDFAPSPLPVGPDGAPKPIGPVGSPPPLPPATPEHFICLRGPCRHYIHLVEAGEFGNVEGTFEEGKEPRQHQHWCDVVNGSYTDIGNNIIFECNRWDPLDEDDSAIVARNHRRSKYLRLHPDHDPRLQKDADVDAALKAQDDVPDFHKDEYSDFPEDMKRPPIASKENADG